MPLPSPQEAAVPLRLIRPLLLVISAPSGAGKSALCARLRADFPGMAYSVSCTTRSPRGEERDGREYHFLAPAAFESKVQAGEFLEWAAVHDHRYGTLRAPVEAGLRAGRDVLMDIDVQGAARIRAAARCDGPNGLLQRAFVDIFVTPPSLAVLRQRKTSTSLPPSFVGLGNSALALADGRVAPNNHARPLAIPSLLENPSNAAPAAHASKAAKFGGLTVRVPAT